MPDAPWLASALWGLALLTSFVGLGRWVAAGLRIRERAHVGLELAWGFAAVLAIGGWLCWLGVAERRVLASLVALGLSGLALRTRRWQRAPASAPSSGSETPAALRVAAAVLCVGLLGLAWAAGLFDLFYHPPDDQAAYLLHARQILETGTLVEPFSFRRMASYGGQSFFHALLLVVAPVERVNFLDKGVARVALGIALLSFALRRPQRSLAAALVAAYVIGAYPDVALNTTSIFTGALAFAGLWLTLDACRRAPERPIANGVLTGLAAAATLPLRQSYALPCALIVLFEHASRRRTASDPRQAQELAVGAASAALCVGGWALLQLHATGTPFFPLQSGHANPEWSLSAAGLPELTNAALKFFGWRTLLFQAALCGLALLGPRRSPHEASLRALSAAALLALCVHVALLGHVHPHDMERYTLAFLLPTLLVGSLCASAWLARAFGTLRLRDPDLWITLGTLLTLLAFLPPTVQLPDRWRMLRSETQLDPSQAVEDVALGTVSLRRLQNAAPAGEKLLVMVDVPFLLDLRRNDVASLDIPGGASPPPGLHRLDAPAEVVEYLVGLGYTWLAAVRPDGSEHLYGLSQWRAHANGVRMDWQYDASDVGPWQVMGRTVLRFFQQLDVIRRSCRHTYADRHWLMIDLSQCRFDEETAAGSAELQR